MTGLEQSTWTKALLIKIHVITGWVLPSGDLQTVLINQLGKHLIENYADVNPDEVEFAFRKWGTTTKDWGKQMNLSLIDEVLLPYIILRGHVSQLEESAKATKELPAPEEGVNDQTMQEWLLQTKATPLAVDFMPVMLYDWLVSKGELQPSNETKRVYLQKAVAYRQYTIQQAYEKDMTKENHEALCRFNQMKAAGEFEGPEVEGLKTLAKKMILFNHLYGDNGTDNTGIKKI